MNNARGGGQAPQGPPVDLPLLLVTVACTIIYCNITFSTFIHVSFPESTCSFFFLPWGVGSGVDAADAPELLLPFPLL